MSRRTRDLPSNTPTEPRPKPKAPFGLPNMKAPHYTYDEQNRPAHYPPHLLLIPPSASLSSCERCSEIQVEVDDMCRKLDGYFSEVVDLSLEMKDVLKDRVKHIYALPQTFARALCDICIIRHGNRLACKNVDLDLRRNLPSYRDWEAENKRQRNREKKMAKEEAHSNNPIRSEQWFDQESGTGSMNCSGGVEDGANVSINSSQAPVRKSETECCNDNTEFKQLRLNGEVETAIKGSIEKQAILHQGSNPIVSTPLAEDEDSADLTSSKEGTTDSSSTSNTTNANDFYGISGSENVDQVDGEKASKRKRHRKKKAKKTQNNDDTDDDEGAEEQTPIDGRSNSNKICGILKGHEKDELQNLKLELQMVKARETSLKISNEKLQRAIENKDFETKSKDTELLIIKNSRAVFESTISTAFERGTATAIHAIDSFLKENGTATNLDSMEVAKIIASSLKDICGHWVEERDTIYLGIAVYEENRRLMERQRRIEKEHFGDLSNSMVELIKKLTEKSGAIGKECFDKLEEITVELKDLRGERGKFREDFQPEEEKWFTLNKQLIQRLKELKTRIAGLEGQNKELHDEIKNCRNLCTTFERIEAEQEKLNHKLSENISMIKSDMRDSTPPNTQLSDNINRLELEKQSLASEKVQLVQHVSNLESRNESLESRNTALIQTVSDLEAEKEELTKKNTQLDESVSCLQTDKQILQSQLSQLEAIGAERHDSMSQTDRDLNQASDAEPSKINLINLSKENERLAYEAQASKTNISNLREENERLIEEGQASKLSVTSLTRQVEKLSEEALVSQIEVATLKQQGETLSRKICDMTKTWTNIGRDVEELRVPRPKNDAGTFVFIKSMIGRYHWAMKWALSSFILLVLFFGFVNTAPKLHLASKCVSLDFSSSPVSIDHACFQSAFGYSPQIIEDGPTSEPIPFYLPPNAAAPEPDQCHKSEIPVPWPPHTPPTDIRPPVQTLPGGWVLFDLFDTPVKRGCWFLGGAGYYQWRRVNSRLRSEQQELHRIRAV